MRKLFLSAVFAGLLVSTSFAQDDKENGGGGFKATGGSVTLEANVNPLEGTVRLSNSLKQIRVRYFLSDDMAIRLGVNVGV